MRRARSSGAATAPASAAAPDHQPHAGAAARHAHRGLGRVAGQVERAGRRGAERRERQDVRGAEAHGVARRARRVSGGSAGTPGLMPTRTPGAPPESGNGPGDAPVPARERCRPSARRCRCRPGRRRTRRCRRPGARSGSRCRRAERTAVDAGEPELRLELLARAERGGPRRSGRGTRERPPPPSPGRSPTATSASTSEKPRSRMDRSESAGRPGRAAAAPRSPTSRPPSAASPTVSQASIFAKFFSPMPFTFMSSCVERNVPDFWRYSTMRAASLGPTPGSVVSCSTVAVLRLTLRGRARACPRRIAVPDTSRAARRGPARWRRSGEASWESSLKGPALVRLVAARRRPGRERCGLADRLPDSRPRRPGARSTVSPFRPPGAVPPHDALHRGKAGAAVADAGAKWLMETRVTPGRAAPEREAAAVKAD